MSTQLTNIILDVLIIASAIVAISISILMISIMMFYKTNMSGNRTTHLLNLNMYASLGIGCSIVLDMYCYTLYGHLFGNISFDGQWCYIKAYFFYVSGCGFFYAYLLQAIYRLCRIVYHRKPALQSFKLYIYGIIIQWILSFVQVIPVFLLGTFKYLPNDYHCQIPIDNITGLIIGLSLVHLIPVSLTTICYIYTTIYIRRSARILKPRDQQTRDHRDFIILTRVFILLAVIIASGMPTLGISLFSQIFGYLPYWSTQFQWLTATFSISCVSIILIFVSPNLQKIRKPNRSKRFLIHHT